MVSMTLLAQTEPSAPPTDPTDLVGWVTWLTGTITALSLFLARVFPPLANIKYKGIGIAALLIVVLVFLRQYGFDDLKTYAGVIIGLLLDLATKANQKWPWSTPE